MTTMKSQTSSGLNPEIIEQAGKIRMRLDADGYKLTDMEYDIILNETARKSSIKGKEESYIPLLLEDEIKDYFFRNAVNAVTFCRMYSAET